MNSSYVHQVFSLKCPKVKIIYNDIYRHEVTDILNNNSIGIELGVAKGFFAERMIKSNKFNLYFGVDVYQDNHDHLELKEALNNVGLFEKKFKLLTKAKE